MKPRLQHFANLWSLTHYPSAKNEWSLERKIAAVKDAKFGGFTTRLTSEHARLAEKHGLFVIGYFSSAKSSEFKSLLQSQKDCGAKMVNVQLGDEDTLTPAALRMTLRLMAESEKLGLETSVEIHRDTCTETPEKIYALADAYKKETGQLLPMTPDYSHIAVVKHLAPPYAKRILTHPKLLQLARQIHCRPFNGHHCQVPVTDAAGRLTPEVKHYLEFIEAMFEMWLKGNRKTAELFVCPEMGPLPSGYNISTLPNSWEDTVRLRPLLAKAWNKALKTL